MSHSFILETVADLRRKQLARLTAIATAALDVFTRDGFGSAQVVDIARRAGLSVGTLYLYADGKQALFELAVRAAAFGAEKSSTFPPRTVSWTPVRSPVRGSIQWAA